MTGAGRGGRPLGIAVVGYGRMGREVDRLAGGLGARTTLRLDGRSNRDGSGLTAEGLRGTDVAIDFSTADALLGGNLERLCELGVDVVIGTTGWEDGCQRVRELVAGSSVGVVFGANFSVGAAVFHQAAIQLAERMARVGAYDLSLSESHHRRKRDAPSGTALRLLGGLREQGLACGDVTSQRTGHGAGTHELAWDSADDVVVLRHAARTRAGFARGALMAARWIHGRKGLFDFADCWEDVVGATGPAPADECAEKVRTIPVRGVSRG